VTINDQPRKPSLKVAQTTSAQRTRILKLAVSSFS